MRVAQTSVNVRVVRRLVKLQMLTQLPILVATPCGEAAVVNNGHHVSLPARYSMYIVHLQRAHPYRLQHTFLPFHSQLPSIV